MKAIDKVKIICSIRAIRGGWFYLALQLNNMSADYEDDDDDYDSHKVAKASSSGLNTTTI